MTSPTGSTAAHAAAPTSSLSCSADAIRSAAERLLPDLQQGRRIDAARLRAAMETGFGGSDAQGFWDWKTAYEACEAASVLFLRQFGPAMRRRASSPAAFLAMLEKIAARFPTHTRRSDESDALQQFSTPIGLGFAAATAAAITPDDVVLEPSAGTGLLAIYAELAGAEMLLNEFAQTRADLLAGLFPQAPPTRFDAAHIDDFLEAETRPSVVLMNPPFTAGAHVAGRVADAALRHLRSALARLADGGRLVAITGASLSPDNPAWRDGFVQLQELARMVFTAPIEGAVYARHGTTMPTRLTVFDKAPAGDPQCFPTAPGVASDAATLLQWQQGTLPPRRPVTPSRVAGAVRRLTPSRAVGVSVRPKIARAAGPDPHTEEIVYETVDWCPPESGHLTDALYEPYALQAIR
ncbi:MAG TPA: class I SAM-dependent methyltransferase, partial [Rhodocyclaceae bacterium]|nr:class I SAM-dependent methyltransferase [Rhodocyclaceae bacterium]